MGQVPLLDVERASEDGIIARAVYDSTFLTRPDTGEEAYYELATGYVSAEWVHDYIEWCDKDEVVAKYDRERKA